MKYITFTVPCYNSAAYMEKCIDSLLPAGDDVEIIIVDDGSKDETGAIGDRYAEKYPDIVRVIHQENGGHGAGVNQGLQNAKGLYFKVIDSDDWADAESLRKVVEFTKQLHTEGNVVDLFFCNYVYEHVEDNTRREINYKNVFPRNKVFGWDDTRTFHVSQFLMMHSMFFRTQILRDAKTELPKHTFYVDNVFMLHPLPYVRTMYYLDTDFYHYFIGRADQSVNQDVFITRIDQHIRVTEILIHDFDMEATHKISPKLERYMTRHIGILVAVTSVFLAMEGTPEALEKREKYWKELAETNKKLYRKLRFTTVAGLTEMHTKGGRFLLTRGYRLTQKIYKYN